MKKRKFGYTLFIILIVLAAMAYFNREALANAGFDLFVQKSVEKKLGSSYKPVEGRESKPEQPERSVDDPFSVLLMGVDQRAGETGRSDTLLYTVVRPSDGHILLVSIPRDAYVELVGRNKKDKINHAYAFGGAGLSMDTVEALLDAPVQHYAAINFEGFRAAIDAMGGIALPIDKDIVNRGYGHDKFTIKGGQSLYNGQDALNFVRYREDAGGDISRAGRHQQFIRAMIEKMKEVKQWSKIPELFDIMGDNFTTDIRPDQLVDLTQNLLRVKNREVYSHTLKGQGGRLQAGGTWYYFMDDNDLQDVKAMIQSWLDKDTPTAELVMPAQQ